MSLKRVMSTAVGASVVAAILFAPPAGAAPYNPGKVQKEKLVAGTAVKPRNITPEKTGKPFQPSAPVWPGSAAVELQLPSAGMRAAGGGAPAKAGNLPVWIDPQIGSKALTNVRVESYDRAVTKASGVDGLLLRVGRIDGIRDAATGRVTIDYSGFRYAYGGEWFSRLRLIELPECALTMPSSAQCRGREIPSKNDHVAGTVTALVSVDGATTSAPTKQVLAGNESASTQGGTIMALAAAPAGNGGDYKATSLSPSATWNAGGNTGDFGWNYPLRVPPALGGPAPSIAFNYSSSSVDGKMATTNSQPSWVGEGFDWNPGFVERRYNACSEDMGNGANNTTKTGDQCWDTDNATIAFAGHAGELIKDASNANRWHLRNDDGTFVERRTGAANGDNDGEWWVATTTDGTQYWFGGRAGSESTLVSTVYGNHSGEPCNHTSGFSYSHCNQAYRWQLDHVVDRNGNTMSLSYAKETNKYAKNNSTTDLVSYDRAGYLTKIEYGTRTGSSGLAPMVVEFTVGDRCLANCGTKTAREWPDVPFDQECTASPCYKGSPSFWTTKRLASVKTRVRNAAGTDYTDVEAWTLTHSFPDPEDSITGALWLEKISHSGLIGTTTTLPDITFAGVHLTNRVDTINDQFPAMNRFRIKSIVSETGGKIDLSYSAPDCVKTTRVPDVNNLQDNKFRCYPVKWTPSGYTNPMTDFFHKYLITEVTENDQGGSSPRVISKYEYLGDPAWHYTDDDGLIKADNKTWSVWRGYGAVKVTKGDPTDVQQVTETRFFRGMHGDKLPSGTRNVQLSAIATGNVPAVNDEDAFAGQVRETITFHAGTEVSAKVSQPWQSTPTATRTINNTTVNARFIATEAGYTRTTLDGGRGPRTTSTKTKFDEYGMPIEVEDRGDDAIADDERCTLTAYTRNVGLWIVDRVSQERKYGVNCAKVQAGGLTNDDIIDESRTSYDGQAWGAAPTVGNATKMEGLSGTGSIITETQSTYDVHGRLLEAWDVRGNKSVTAYTPATDGPVTIKTETSPLGWVNTTVMEPAWNVPLSSTDHNGRKVGYAYDGLGRLTSVWLPGRNKGADSANIMYEYLVRNTAATVLTSKKLNPAGSGYVTSYKLFDSLTRARQTQDFDPTGGTAAVVTDTVYDTAGRAYKTHEPYLAADPLLNPVAPSTDLHKPSGNIPSLKVRLFDGTGRETALITKVSGPPASEGGTEQWRTSTVYGGDRTDIIPQAGSAATSTITDAQGGIVEHRQYLTGVTPGHAVAASQYETTKYAYDRKGQLTKLTDALGNTWQYSYDMLGRQITSVDPDKGTATSNYNDAGDLISSTDSRGQTLTYTYDTIGRKRTLHKGTKDDPKLSEWLYDALSNGTFVYGHMVKSVRYVGTDKYEKEQLGFNADYQPTTIKYSIPATETGLNGDYNYVYTYKADRSTGTTRLPALGDLATEQLTHGYNEFGKPTTLSTSINSTTLVTGTDYTSFGEVAAIHLRNNGGKQAHIERVYESDTRRLAQIKTSRDTAPQTVADVRLSYDATGNVTKISDLTAGDNQCFTTDHHRRLTEAWTPANGDCLATRSTDTLGGPAKYWQSFEYDPTGSRKKLVDHVTAAGERTVNYTVPAGKHRVDATSTKDNTGTVNATYTYDNAGNTLTRPTAAAGVQTLTWDPEGRLATSVDTTGETSYVYDADGNRLIRKDPTGKTLFLPGQELRYTSGTGTKKCTRYYSTGDQIVAMRSVAGVQWLAGDHHGTVQTTINANATQAVATRRETPFGEQRSSAGTWPSGMDKGFVGGTKDNTGLTHLGAREYDPLLGQFISIDPVIDNKDPQQLHGYSYANNTPITACDPDGLWPKFLDNAVKNVTNVVKDVSSHVVTGIYNNAGLISAVTGVAALVCTFVPPLQVLAPALGAISMVTGAIDTYKSCSEGQAIDCAAGVAGMIPGVRQVKAGFAGAKAGLTGMKKLVKAADEMDIAKQVYKTASSRMEQTSRRWMKETNRIFKEERSKLMPWAKGNRGNGLLMLENLAWEGSKLMRDPEKYNDRSRQHSYTPWNWGPLWGKDWGGKVKLNPQVTYLKNKWDL